MIHIPVALSLQPASGSKFTWVGVETWFAKIRTGKTHHIVKTRVLPALSEGRHVFTNIDFGPDVKVGDTIIMTSEEQAGMKLSYFLGKDVRKLIHIRQSSFFSRQLELKDTNAELTCIPPGSRVIIDEAQNIFPINGFKTANDNFFKLLTYCGHFDIDFVFITQNPALLDKRIISSSSELMMIKNLGLFSSFQLWWGFGEVCIKLTSV